MSLHIYNVDKQCILTDFISPKGNQFLIALYRIPFCTGFLNIRAGPRGLPNRLLIRALRIFYRHFFDFDGHLFVICIKDKGNKLHEHHLFPISCFKYSTKKQKVQDGLGRLYQIIYLRHALKVCPFQAGRRYDSFGVLGGSETPNKRNLSVQIRCLRRPWLCGDRAKI